MLLLAFVCAVLTYRFVLIRNGGTQAVIRRKPHSGSGGWRHGLIRYGEDELVIFKLSSLRFGPDYRLNRQGIDVGTRRLPVPVEAEIMTDDVRIIQLTEGAEWYELALEPGALTAFLSWVESRPSGRSRRGRPH
ncbi:DUF2550 domain-containing protein [Smaragdicoccus niigatensis]|uniref:DUF2550 domain-containing protein n=1 Tax=Smaragdicoccus niigatensis TaxID=359359 RepID=UPI00068673CE